MAKLVRFWNVNEWILYAKGFYALRGYDQLKVTEANVDTSSFVESSSQYIWSLETSAC